MNEPDDASRKAKAMEAVDEVRREMGGWRSVMSPIGGFDRDLPMETLCEFKHSTWEEPQVFRLGAVSPWFNVAGLYWRLPPPPGGE